MVSRERITNEGDGQHEYYSVYRQNLKQEARVLRTRLLGRWVWKTFFALDLSKGKDLPLGAKIFELDKTTRSMVQTKTVGKAGTQYYVKFPPYVKTTGESLQPIGQRRRAQQRELRNEREKHAARKADTADPK